MKISLLISIIILSLISFQAFAEKASKKTAVKMETKKEVKAAVPVAPCDSKEDILKKLEEKKKAESKAVKAFSLQGGDTGCSVK